MNLSLNLRYAAYYLFDVFIIIDMFIKFSFLYIKSSDSIVLYVTFQSAINKIQNLHIVYISKFYVYFYDLDLMNNTVLGIC